MPSSSDLHWNNFDDENEQRAAVLTMDRRRGFLAQNCQRGKRGICISVLLFSIIICAVLLAYTAFAAPTSNENTLQQVILIFRHGDRNPTETYAKDPYRNYNWPDGWGALTKKGMAQLYNLGQWIRNNYGFLIGKKFYSSVISVESSYADRCIMSAQALLAGLFPPSVDDMFIPNLAWRPVPVHSTPRDLDKIIVVKAPCPRLEQALTEAYEQESAARSPEMIRYYQELTELTGNEMKTITDVEFLYNTLEIEELKGLKLPEWTKKYYNRNMREMAAKSLAIFTNSTIQQRLTGGPLLKEILKHMQAAKLRTQWKRAHLYSVHDITLVNILRTMGFRSELFKPEYGATLIFELHSTNTGSDKEVKVRYLNSTESTLTHPMTIEGCPEPCFLENLPITWKDVLPDNWDKECFN
ncbi:lysosomal acid phosphatase-like isoform X2 [Prorops nasuta]|uniref:lysosomal acid phosphatase-like isoform X2 n=1 Tax=Prorops nasuta TaxID=863751 RepID=UPI0034CEDE27